MPHILSMSEFFLRWVELISGNRVLRLADMLIVLAQLMLLAGMGFILFLFALWCATPPSAAKVMDESAFWMFFSLPALAGQDYSFMAEHTGRWVGWELVLRPMLHLCSYVALLMLLRQFIRNSRRCESYFRDNAVLFRLMFYWSLPPLVASFVPSFIPVAEVDFEMLGLFRFSVNCPLVYFLLSLLCLIFSEVFREGERLKAESDYTI